MIEDMDDSVEWLESGASIEQSLNAGEDGGEGKFLRCVTEADLPKKRSDERRGLWTE